ncbi:MAG: hypothetical protein M3155_05635, partial [Actinomycetota bacterium]|nr:hypothetical protein [Actinomycetota bacterium]
MNAHPRPYAPHWPTAEPGPSLAERLALVAIAVLFTGTALLWCAGQLAGLLFSGSWPAVSIADMAGVVIRLPARLGDPRAAWPEPARATLPAAVALYAVFA